MDRFVTKVLCLFSLVTDWWLMWRRLRLVIENWLARLIDVTIILFSLIEIGGGPLVTEVLCLLIYSLMVGYCGCGYNWLLDLLVWQDFDGHGGWGCTVG
jgi:hypothetical protein